MSGFIGGISTATTSFSLANIESLRKQVATIDLGTNITDKSSQLVNEIKKAVSSDFSPQSMSTLKALFNDFHSKLSEAHPDLLSEVLGAMNKSAVSDFLINQSAPTDAPPPRDLFPAELMSKFQFIVTVSGLSSSASEKGDAFTVDGECLAAALSGDLSSISAIQTQALGLRSDQVVTQSTSVASPSPNELHHGSITTAASSSESDDERVDIQISPELLAGLQAGNLGAIGALGGISAAAVLPSDGVSGGGISSGPSPDALFAAIAMIRQIMAKEGRPLSPHDTMTPPALEMVGKGIVNGINKLTASEKKRDSNKGGKPQEDIDLAIKKVKAHLQDGIDNIDELGQIAGVLMDIPLSQLGPILDEIKIAMNEFLEQQAGQLSGSDVRALMTTANEIVGTLTGATLFSEDEINQTVDVMSQAAPELTASDYSGTLTSHSDPNSVTDAESFDDSSPKLPSTGAQMSAAKPKTLDMNSLQFNTSVSQTGGLRVSAASNASGDTSSDRNGAQRKAGEIINFLEKLCETGMDRIMHQLTKQLDKTGLTKLIKANGLGFDTSLLD